MPIFYEVWAIPPDKQKPTIYGKFRKKHWQWALKLQFQLQTHNFREVVVQEVEGKEVPERGM